MHRPGPNGVTSPAASQHGTIKQAIFRQWLACLNHRGNGSPQWWLGRCRGAAIMSGEMGDDGEVPAALDVRFPLPALVQRRVGGCSGSPAARADCRRAGLGDDLGVCRFHQPVQVMLDSRQPPRAETNLGYLSASAVHSRSPTVRSTGVGAVQRANFDLRAGMLVSDRPDAVHRDPQATHDRALAWQCD